jgi:hypothetical protein
VRSRALAWVGALVVAACSSGFHVDQDEFCRRQPTAPSCPAPGGAAGASGFAGAGGASGVGGAGGVSGLGGGGAGGGPCASDGACAADEGAGSLCVGETCTAPTGACAKGTLVVVPDAAFAGELSADLEGACFYRALGPALAAAAAPASGTTRVLVYAAAVEGPAQVPGGVRLEGRATAPATLVALTGGGTSGAGGGAGASGAGGGGATPVLVTLGAGAALSGFALDGKGVVGGVRAEAGAVRLDGPLTIANTTRALDLGGTADATVAGTEAAPVLVKGNQLGIVVGATAKLALTGDGDKGGVTVEGTTAGAGVLVLAGGVTATVRLEGLLAKDNKVSTADGSGAVELRQGRSVTIKNGVFEGNSRSLTLNGELTSDFTSFTNVVLEGNRFTLATPGQGSTICGSKLGNQTELNLGPGNVFPLAMTTCPPAQVDSCNTGADVGYDTVNQFAIACQGG